MAYEVSREIGGRTLTIESGKLALQAHGAVTVRYADTIVLVTACAADAREDVDFFPLTIEFREKGYAAGKIPGSIFKREGRPSDNEILSARLIDHQTRPLFPKGFAKEVQVIVSVLSFDQENDADILGSIGASCALSISEIPFLGPIAAVRVGKVNGQLILNPSFDQREEGRMDIVVAGNSISLINMEGGTREVSEEELVEALSFAHQHIRTICQMQEELMAQCGKQKMPVLVHQTPEIDAAVDRLAADKIRGMFPIGQKQDRALILDQIRAEVSEALADQFPESQEAIARRIALLEREEMRRGVLEKGVRQDGRKADEIRTITCEVGVLPRAHGSALFTRGQTQSLGTVTLGTKMDERLVDVLEGKSFKSYMLDYNFPPSATGEVRPIRGVSRREVGHGHLAERAIEPVVPSEESFPYTIRIVSDILESNGSSSMATVCAGSLALMDAGIPVKEAVAGIGMGLITGNGKAVVLTDIAGLEDHEGDMDLKITGTRRGITAFQMDLKVQGITLETMRQALEHARQARLAILDIMQRTIAAPRAELSPYAPRIITYKIQPDQIGAVIGTGGKVVREIQEVSGATVEIEDDGTIIISSVDQSAGEKALEMVKRIVEVPEVGKVYDGVVKRVMPFGAFVEILPGKEGLVHISELEFRRVQKVEDVLNMGDRVQVKVIGIDDQGKVKLSRKAVLRR